MKKAFWAVAVLCVTTWLVRPALGQIPTVVKVTGGRIEGTVSDGETVFKGIPFAAPPVGKLRWLAPQPVVPWAGVKRADAYGPPCMQNAMGMKFLGVSRSPSEDCLYLNLWTPANSTGAKLPVMVWIYGGAFTGGAAALFDGETLAKEGVVIVTLSYRLGPFGFLATPALSRESGHGTGDQGLEDQVAALRWVKHNISRFGGNPDNVTIFGESAGGISVSMLAASPLARGLFQKAISESGGYFSPPRERAGEGGTLGLPLARAEEMGQAFLARLGAHDLKSARALPAATIERGAEAGKFGGMFWPDFDGHVLTADSYELYEEGKFNDTPILIGTNAQDGYIFVKSASTASWVRSVRSQFGAKAGELLAAYPHGTPAQTLQSARDLFGDLTFGWPTYAWAALETTHGSNKAYVYYFLHETPKAPNGAVHGTEQLFVWGNLSSRLAALFGIGHSAHDEAISRQMRRYWTNFAKTGDPNGVGLPDWPAYSESDPQALQIDPTMAIPYPNLARLRAIGDYYSWRNAQNQNGGKLARSGR